MDNTIHCRNRTYTVIAGILVLLLLVSAAPMRVVASHPQESVYWFGPPDADADGVPDDDDKCPHTPPGTKVNRFGCHDPNADGDGDGVIDVWDKCPDTPPGTEVDREGCPDTDLDGVIDRQDNCPNTPPGTAVDQFGCPDPDTDADGKPDTRDRCPNTPPGTRVDGWGCPDIDGDGVPQNYDLCPNTPPGIRVTRWGCPDIDGDGVPQNRDKCPDTPPGTAVDQFGCPDPDTDADGVRDGRVIGTGSPPGTEVDKLGYPDMDGDAVSDRWDYCAGTPPGTRVNDDGCPDKDGDGVRDTLDTCPDTPPETPVDRYGCADTDGDGDGVGDHQDYCPNTPPGTPVDRVGCSTEDQDGDGVHDERDRCPGTPPGSTVDSWGCPDPDGDRVSDLLDKCPGTPPGTDVDKEGCPDTDGDGVSDLLDKCPDTPPGTDADKWGCRKPGTDVDGVPEYRDKCPDTPPRTEVDKEGCPDTDLDGVNDYRDKCPGTPPGTEVDKEGCPDTDLDGVNDYRDKCPDTPPGTEVDKEGCHDTDWDGVNDYRDKCPDTPDEAWPLEVDESGCPDLDGDGVPQNKDKCPDTPQLFAVDASGCPDIDGDGVPQNRDNCVPTPRGTEVDAFGCPKVDADGDGVGDAADHCADTPPGTLVDGRGCPLDGADEDGARDGRDKGSDTPPGTVTDTTAPLPVCDLGEVVLGNRVLNRAMLTRPVPTMSPGPLFSDGGSFAEHEVDAPCDPGKELGPFPVSAGGKLVARVSGSPATKNVWSLGNSGTWLGIYYEPQLGDDYGPAQEIFAMAIPVEETEIEGGAEWPGPGRLRAYTGAPKGSGPLSGQCFKQSYTVEAEIVEVFPSAPLQPGMRLQDGDRITTEPSWGDATVELMSGGISAGTALIGPGSDVTLINETSGASAEAGTCQPAPTKVVVNAGSIRISQEIGTSGMPISVDVAGTLIVPKGTEFSVEKQDETTTVRVFEGAVEITSPDGQRLTLVAGQQVTLPDGTISDFDLASDDGGLVDGIPLGALPLDDDTPLPSDTYVPDFKDDSLPPDWLWQTYYAPGTAEASLLETPEPGVLRVTVPSNNVFGNDRGDAPRLLHKATGDFDLEAEMLQECESLNWAVSEFIIFTPGSPLGYLEKQMAADGLKSQYFKVGGWHRWNDLNKLTAPNRPFEDGPDAPDTPVRFKMSRRGDVLKTYWSTDGGETWTLSNRQVLPLPETLWAGWVFMRDAAWNNLYDKPAITTLRDIRLTTAPLNTLPEGEWDVVDYAGEVIPLDTELMMSQDGSQPGYVQAYSPWSIPGDFDLVVGFDAPPLEDQQPGQERYIHVSVTSGDETDLAYVRNAQSPEWPHRYDTYMEINDVGNYRLYHSEDTQDHSGRVRLVRQGDVFSSYFWKDGDWALLGDWNTGFTEPVYLDFRFQWKTPTPTPQTVRFTIERLETPDGTRTGLVEEGQPPSAEPSPVPEGDSGFFGGEPTSEPEATQPKPEGTTGTGFFGGEASPEPEVSQPTPEGTTDTGFFGGDASPTPEVSQPTPEDIALVQPTSVPQETVVAVEQPTPALPLPGERPGIAEFIATPPEAAPGEWVTLSWRTSGGEPDLFRLDAAGQPKQESSDVLIPTGSMEVPIEGNPGDEVTFVLGLLSPDQSEWIETSTVTVKVTAAELPPLPPLPVDPYEPPSLQPQPQSQQPEFGPVTFSSAFDEATGTAIDTGQSFPAGTSLVWVSWRYSGVIPETQYDFHWFDAKSQLIQQGRNNFWAGSGLTWEWLGDGYTPLEPGTYTFFFSVDGQRYEGGAVIIEAPAAAPPPAQPQVQPVPGAFTVFFTIDASGRPSGYVFDKEGRQFHPAEGMLTCSCA